MRLGFWNRLAIVATALVVLIAPAWHILDENQKAFVRQELIYESCTRFADGMTARATTPAQFTEALHEQNQCSRAHRDSIYTLGWEEWFYAVLAALAACLVIYLLILATTSTARWVWRGRATKVRE